MKTVAAGAGKASRIGIWCVACPPRMKVGTGRWAVRDGKPLSFATEAEAMAETRRLRSIAEPNRWIFFPYPLPDGGAQ